MAICLSAVGGLTSINNLKLKQGGFYEKRNAAKYNDCTYRRMFTMLTACMKGAPDDAYMIDLTDERNVVINDSIVFWADGDIEKNKLLEQFIFEEFNDCFNTNIPNFGRIDNDDKEAATKAAEYFLKEYFGT